MAIIRTNNQHYTDIANAIRYKKGVSTQYLPSEMAEAIRSISSGGGRCPHADVLSSYSLSDLGLTWVSSAIEQEE